MTGVSEHLERKIKQMHAAFARSRSSDLTPVQAEIGAIRGYEYMEVNFGRHADRIELANAASLLVANIASIKDHLKAWCKQHNVQFNGDALIDGNRSVAIVHDLWNVDKHSEITRPRSGRVPKITNLRTVMSLSAGAGGGGVRITVDPRTGRLVTDATGSGKAELILCAEVVDENGTPVGDLMQLCTEAADAWLAELRAAGVPVP